MSGRSPVDSTPPLDPRYEPPLEPWWASLWRLIKLPAVMVAALFRRR